MLQDKRVRNGASNYEKKSFVLRRLLRKGKSNIETKRKKTTENKTRDKETKYFSYRFLFSLFLPDLCGIKKAQYFDHFLINKACLLIAFKRY